MPASVGSDGVVDEGGGERDDGVQTFEGLPSCCGLSFRCSTGVGGSTGNA